MDLDLVHSFISRSYWASGIPIDTLKKAMENSLCFGVFHEKDGQVGFARMITDKATFAYLADVFILQEHRGLGLSKQLMSEIISHPDLQGLRRMALATRDAHDLYRKFGFTSLASPETFMELWSPDVYKVHA
jgi:GNAT superfamily N-acetyltransferase